jgi:hypothetical protein
VEILWNEEFGAGGQCLEWLVVSGWWLAKNKKLRHAQLSITKPSISILANWA